MGLVGQPGKKLLRRLGRRRLRPGDSGQRERVVGGVEVAGAEELEEDYV